MTKKVAFHTLGCKANQYDTEIMKDAVRSEAGYGVEPFSGNPEIIVINTCSVTTGADRKSRKYIRRAARTGELVLVTGCYTVLDSEEIAEISGVDVIFPNSYKYEIIDIIGRAESGFRGKVEGSEGGTWDLNRRTISRDSNHTRAFLKIQDGCSNTCSFCKVRFLRGPTRSKTPNRVVEEARNLGEKGFREIVLTGINLAEYGTGDELLPELIRELSRLDEVSRIRLSSINPDGITRDLLRAFRDSDKSCPYFHVPLQSGSNRILNAMNRGYTREYYLDRVELIRSYLPNSTIGTDLMVGFPGEKEADFAKTEEMVKEVGFINVHVFRYSPRTATPAADFEEKVDSSEKKRRAEELRSIASSTSLVRRRRFYGENLDMIVEEPSNKIDGWRGYSRNYLDIHLHSDNLASKLTPGETTEVELSEVKEDFCLANQRPSGVGLEKVTEGTKTGKEIDRE